MWGLPWITTLVTPGEIHQWFLLVTASRENRCRITPLLTTKIVIHGNPYTCTYHSIFHLSALPMSRGYVFPMNKRHVRRGCLCQCQVWPTIYFCLFHAVCNVLLWNPDMSNVFRIKFRLLLFFYYIWSCRYIYISIYIYIYKKRLWRQK